jgi:hypothetical protein
MLTTKLRHSHPALGLPQHRHDLRVRKSALLHPNLLVQNTEKILLPNPLEKRGDYPLTRRKICQTMKSSLQTEGAPSGRDISGRTPITVFKTGLPKPTPQKNEKSPPQKTNNQLAA